MYPLPEREVQDAPNLYPNKAELRLAGVHPLMPQRLRLHPGQALDPTPQKWQASCELPA